MDALNLLRGLAIQTSNLIKEASYIKSEGKHIELTDKAIVRNPRIRSVIRLGFISAKKFQEQPQA